MAGSELARHGLPPHDQPARSKGVQMRFAHVMAALPLLFAGVPVPAQAPARAETVDTRRMSEMTRVLASDAFEGRSMGTAGEERTVAYLIEQFQKAGLEPRGENGGWTQTVP